MNGKLILTSEYFRIIDFSMYDKWKGVRRSPKVHGATACSVS